MSVSLIARKGLLRELSIILLLKCAALLLIWWFFVRDAGVTVDAGRTATHLNVAAPRSAR